MHWQRKTTADSMELKKTEQVSDDGKTFSICSSHMSKVPLSILSTYRTELFGLSILWIMMYHSYLCEISPPVLFRWIALGSTGVEIFLFLSGIGLYYSYHKEQNPVSFYKRRLLRIYIPVLLICTPYWIYQYITTDHSVITLIRKYLLVEFWFSGYQQVWFVSLIALGYLVYPFLYRYLFGIEGQRDLVIWAKALWLAALTMLVLAGIEHIIPDYYAATEIALTRIPVFILGCAMGKTVYDKKELSWWWLPVLAAVMVIAFYLILSGKVDYKPLKRYMRIAGAIPLTLLAAVLFSRFHQARILAVFRFFGRISLECYLTHIIWISLYHRNILLCYVPGSVPRYAAILAISILLAYLAGKIGKKIRSGLGIRLMHNPGSG